MLSPSHETLRCAQGDKKIVILKEHGDRRISRLSAARWLTQLSSNRETLRCAQGDKKIVILKEHGD